MVSTTSSVRSKNERKRSVNNFRPCILEYQGAMRLLWSIIEPSPSILGKNADDKIVTMYQSERQRSVNDFWSCIMDNPTAMDRRSSTMDLSGAFRGVNARDDIASASNNWAPTDSQQFLWRLRTLLNNELYCAVPTSSFTRSVFAI